jgi:hypothetical protein
MQDLEDVDADLIRKTVTSTSETIIKGMKKSRASFQSQVGWSFL